MLKNYFTTLFRNLTRNKVNTIINITGLAVSIACCIVIYVFVRHEKTFDNFHKKKDRIYRVVMDEKGAQGTSHNGYINFAFASALRNDFPQLEAVTQVYSENTAIVAIPDAGGGRKLFEENEMMFADEAFLKTFDFSLLAGNAQTLLGSPDEVVLTQKLADKFFGPGYQNRYNELLGKNITVNKKPYRISGIMEDVPRNSNIPFRMLLPFKSFFRDNQYLVNNWKEVYSQNYTFVTLPENYTEQQLEAALVSFKNKYLDQESAGRQTYHLQPLSEVHTDEKYGGTLYATPSVLILAFVVMGVIVLLTACINFINLATAQSLKRAKEIGIRKTLGSRNWQLLVQFMSETMLLTIVAAGIAVLLANQFLDAFNQYLAFIVDLGLHIDTSIIIFLSGMVLLITFLAGYYPARVMAGYQPIQALKHGIKAKNTGFSNRFSLRKVLVVTQFTISQLLIIGTIIVATQMKYFLSRDLGYRKGEILTVDIPENDPQKLALFRNNLLSQSGIKNVSFSSGPPTSASNSYSEVSRTETATEKYSTERKFVDPAFLPTFDIKLLAGRNLQESDKFLLNDSLTAYNIVVTQKTSETLGFKTPQEAIGQEIAVNGRERATIIGVTNNFHNVPLQRGVENCLLFYATNWVNTANIHMNLDDLQNKLAAIRFNWQKLFPDHVFKAATLEQYIHDRAFYVLEDIMYQAFKIFVVLSILIGCLGLYGLVSFLSIQRQKEISIRKVLGASSNGIVYLFSKEFVWLVIIGFLIAAPLGYLAMNAWLQSFSNRIDVHAGYFLIAFIASLLIAAVTVGFEALKAARANPAKSLRTE